MLNRFISLIKKTPKKIDTKNVVGNTKHNVSNKYISRGSMSVITKLQENGYEAYLVGGGVRDLLLGGKPKDFDVATNATPEQVKTLFRNAHIIGKRFRIVHVRFGREIVEVTTFRAGHETAKKESQAVQSDKGILLRDNVYGDLESDALRRDFTVNALYYNPTTQEVTDFTGGLNDLDNRILRIIGDPELRFKEDPVRMLRAVRFACKLGFVLEASVEENILDHTNYLAEIPSARLFDEVLKLFMSGSALATLHKLKEFNLLEHLFPGLALCLSQGESIENELVFCAATNTDKRVRQGKSVTPAFIYASFLWPPLQAAIRHAKEVNNASPHDALFQGAQGVINQQLAVTSIPKRFLIPMREIWSLQSRLEKNYGKRALDMLENPRFRAAYDFLLLREQAGENINGLGAWWTTFQHADAETRETMLKASSGKSKPRRRRRKPKKSTASTTAQNETPS